jgi:glutathione peroxidase
MAKSVHEFTVKTLSGQERSLADYAGKVLVLVNVASKCGLTPQYADLQEFYETHKSKGIEVLGFPANNFGAQEPGSDSEIQAFCEANYGVSFPMFSKISVKGEDQHPLYAYLTQTTGQDVIWNFQKFLVNKQGEVVQAVNPQTLVSAPEVQAKLLELL